MIHCDQLTKSYRTKAGDVQALDGVTLQVAPGEFVCIRGPSGCGKSTLLLAVGGMLRPTAGSLRIAGRELYSLPATQRAHFRNTELGFVFQMFHLVPYLTVLENVLLPANAATPEVRARARALLDQLGLAARSHHRPAQLSAGERQRTAIARALLRQPKVILADEPTGNLDPANADAVFQHLKGFQRGGGTVLLVTHGATAEGLADRVLEMRSGKIAH